MLIIVDQANGYDRQSVSVLRPDDGSKEDVKLWWQEISPSLLRLLQVAGYSEEQRSRYETFVLQNVAQISWSGAALRRHTTL